MRKKSKISRNQSHKDAPTTEEKLYIQDKTSYFNLDIVNLYHVLYMYFLSNKSFLYFILVILGIFIFTFRDLGYLGKSIMGTFAC